MAIKTETLEQQRPQLCDELLPTVEKLDPRAFDFTSGPFRRARIYDDEAGTDTPAIVRHSELGALINNSLLVLIGMDLVKPLVGDEVRGTIDDGELRMFTVKVLCSTDEGDAVLSERAGDDIGKIYRKVMEERQKLGLDKAPAFVPEIPVPEGISY